MYELTVGVIGYGYMGRLHARAYQSFRQTRLIAVADLDDASLSAAPAGVSRYRDYRELLEDNLDAVSICLPTCLHYEATLNALAAGKHVLLEKPIAADAAEARRMIEAARAAGRVLLVGMTHRFYPELREAKRLIDEGVIGEIVACDDRIVECLKQPQWCRWLLDRRSAGGGVAMSAGIHLVDRLRWFTDQDVVRVAGSCGNPYWHGSVEDAGQMFLWFRSGISAQITMAFTREDHPLLCDLQILGTHGSVIVHTWQGYEVCSATRKSSRVYYTNESHEDKILAGVYGEVEELYRSIRESRSPWPSAEEGARALEVVLAYYRAAEVGLPVSTTGGFSLNEPDGATDGDVRPAASPLPCHRPVRRD